MLAWRLPYRWALLGQVGISVAALMGAAAFSLAASSSGFLEGEVLVAFGLAVFLLAWQIGLEALISWFANRAANPKLMPFRLRRLRWATSFAMLWLCLGVGAAAFALLSLTGPPYVGAGDQPVGPQANRKPTRIAAAVAPVPAHTMPDADGSPVPPAARGEDTSKVIGAVHAWAAAWAKRDVARYLGSYAYQFRTPNGESRADWQATRRQRIENAKRIAVRIELPEVAYVDAGTATVRFRQYYESDTFSETSRKILVMTYVDGEWRILEERRSGK
jgi:hypothetical protein